MKKIESLTKEQEARYSEFVDRWLKVGLSTESVNKTLGEKAATESYRIAGLSPPEKIIWFEGPISLVIGDSILRASVRESVWESVGASVGESVRASVRESVWESVRASVRASVWTSVRASVWESVWESVWTSVGASVRESVWESVGASVGESVRESVWESVGASVGASVEESVGASVWESVWASVGASVGESVYGQHDSGWLSFYSYFLEVCNLECCKKLLPLMHLAENCGWWIPRKGIVLLSEKPIHCNVDERKLLHDEGKMAIKYKDGFGVYACHGVRLPEKYGQKKYSEWESSWLLKEGNAELRRVLIQQIGYEKMFRELEAKKIDSWREYELFHLAQNVDVEPIRLLKMTCPSTNRVHVHRVSPEIMFAREAITQVNSGIDPERFIYET